MCARRTSCTAEEGASGTKTLHLCGLIVNPELFFICVFLDDINFLCACVWDLTCPFNCQSDEC